MLNKSHSVHKTHAPLAAHRLELAEDEDLVPIRSQVHQHAVERLHLAAALDDAAVDAHARVKARLRNPEGVHANLRVGVKAVRWRGRSARKKKVSKKAQKSTATN